MKRKKVDLSGFGEKETSSVDSVTLAMERKSNFSLSLTNYQILLRLRKLVLNMKFNVPKNVFPQNLQRISNFSKYYAILPPSINKF